MTHTPNPQQQPDAIERRLQDDEHEDGAVEHPEMAVLRRIAEHRIRLLAPGVAPGVAPETALSHLIEGFRRHPTWPIVRADAVIFLYDALLLLGVGEQAIRDALGFDACVRISQIAFGTPRWERVERPQSGNGPTGPDR